jgi:hypothetical protein
MKGPTDLGLDAWRRRRFPTYLGFYMWAARRANRGGRRAFIQPR